MRDFYVYIFYKKYIMAAPFHIFCLLEVWVRIGYRALIHKQSEMQQLSPRFISLAVIY